MAYGQWKLDEKMTFDEFGYRSSELTRGSKKPVKCKCEACGVIANKRFRESSARHICNAIIDGKKKCYKCKTFKLVNEFAKNRNSPNGYSKLCKECYSNHDSVILSYKKRSSLIRTDIIAYFEYKTNYLKYKCALKNIPFGLDKSYLYNMYIAQNKKCHYSGIELFHNIGCSDYNSISVERLDPELGYIPGNIALVAFNINSFKGMMNESEFKEFLKKVLPNLTKYAET